MGFLLGAWKFIAGGGWKYILAVVILGFVLKFGYGAYTTYTDAIEQNVILAEDKARLETVNDQNEATIAEMERQKERQAQLMRELETGLADAEEYASELQSLLAEHNLTYLAISRPGLIERRINDATDNVFRAIQCDTGGLCPE